MRPWTWNHIWARMCKNWIRSNSKQRRMPRQHSLLCSKRYEISGYRITRPSAGPTLFYEFLCCLRCCFVKSLCPQEPEATRASRSRSSTSSSVNSLSFSGVSYDHTGTRIVWSLLYNLINVRIGFKHLIFQLTAQIVRLMKAIVFTPFGWLFMRSTMSMCTICFSRPTPAKPRDVLLCGCVRTARGAPTSEVMVLCRFFKGNMVPWMLRSVSVLFCSRFAMGQCAERRGGQ